MATRHVVRVRTAVIGVAAALIGGACVPPQAQPVQPQASVLVPSAPAAAGRAVSRRDLEARAAQLERDPRRGAEAAAIRARLRDGDFRVGDAIVLNVVNVPQFSDTFPVRAGVVVQLPEIAPIPLSGVLRSELEPHLHRYIGRYVINPTVEAYSLVRVAVAGAVARPGFYEVRPDAPVSQVVMTAGGLTTEGDATKISVRRAGRTVIPEDRLRVSMSMGATLDDLSIRPGDELQVGDRPRRNWTEVARTASYVIAIATGLWALGRQ